MADENTNATTPEGAGGTNTSTGADTQTPPDNTPNNPGQPKADINDIVKNQYKAGQGKAYETVEKHLKALLKAQGVEFSDEEMKKQNWETMIDRYRDQVSQTAVKTGDPGENPAFLKAKEALTSTQAALEAEKAGREQDRFNYRIEREVEKVIETNGQVIPAIMSKVARYFRDDYNFIEKDGSIFATELNSQGLIIRDKTSLNELSMQDVFNNWLDVNNHLKKSSGTSGSGGESLSGTGGANVVWTSEKLQELAIKDPKKYREMFPVIMEQIRKQEKR